MVKAVMRGLQSDVFFPFVSGIADQRTEMRSMKNCLPSWRLSADTGANAGRSKVIDGRNRDADLV
jgi:hypothetical protein